MTNSNDQLGVGGGAQQQVSERAKGEFLLNLSIAANDIILPAFEDFVAQAEPQQYAAKHQAGSNQHGQPFFTLFLIPGAGKAFPDDELEAYTYTITGIPEQAELKYSAQISTDTSSSSFVHELATIASLTRSDLDNKIQAWVSQIQD